MNSIKNKTLFWNLNFAIFYGLVGVLMALSHNGLMHELSFVYSFIALPIIFLLFNFALFKSQKIGKEWMASASLSLGIFNSIFLLLGLLIFLLKNIYFDYFSILFPIYIICFAYINIISIFVCMVGLLLGFVGVTTVKKNAAIIGIILLSAGLLVAVNGWNVEIFYHGPQILF